MLSSISHPRYLLFLVVFALGVSGLSLYIARQEAIIAGFDLAALVYILSCLHLWRSGNSDVMRAHAQRDDAGQGLLLALSGLISFVILAALSMLLLDKSGLDGVGIALLIATLVCAWAFTNLIFAFHYARLYYSALEAARDDTAPSDRAKRVDHEGLAFPEDDEPDFSDFVNFAFVIGMTCQTADITITKAAMRRVTTFHGLFAFAFNLGILALSVNVLAGRT